MTRLRINSFCPRLCPLYVGYRSKEYAMSYVLQNLIISIPNKIEIGDRILLWIMEDLNYYTVCTIDELES